MKNRSRRRAAVALCACLLLPLPALAGSRGGPLPAREVSVIALLWQRLLDLLALPGPEATDPHPAIAASETPSPPEPSSDRGATIDPNG